MSEQQQEEKGFIGSLVDTGGELVSGAWGLTKDFVGSFFDGGMETQYSRSQQDAMSAEQKAHLSGLANKDAQMFDLINMHGGKDTANGIDTPFDEMGLEQRLVGIHPFNIANNLFARFTTGGGRESEGPEVAPRTPTVASNPNDRGSGIV